MHIRGTDNPRCEVCVHCRKTANGEKLLCKISETETKENGKCGKFKYDIFKYKSADKARIGKFKKEDFEL